MVTCLNKQDGHFHIYAPMGTLLVLTRTLLVHLFIQVTLYALNPDDGSEWRRGLQQQGAPSSEGTHRFVDLSLSLQGSEGDSIAQAAQRIAVDHPHILIDLGGFTSNSKPGIFSLCPAPVQVGVAPV